MPVPWWSQSPELRDSDATHTARTDHCHTANPPSPLATTFTFTFSPSPSCDLQPRAFQ